MTKVSHTDRGIPAQWVSSSDGKDLIVRAARPRRLNRIAVICQKAMNYLVPVGYEDETGFHYGEAPAPSTAKSPSDRAV